MQPRSLGGCSTIEELQQLLEDGETDRILVAADIVLEEDSDIQLEAETSVTIDMNGNRLIIPSGTYLRVSGPIRIEGDAPGRALIDIEGDFMLRGGAAIAARGEACTAVLCRSPGVGLTTWDASVTSEGTRAGQLFGKAEKNAVWSMF